MVMKVLREWDKLVCTCILVSRDSSSENFLLAKKKFAAMNNLRSKRNLQVDEYLENCRVIYIRNGLNLA